LADKFVAKEVWQTPTLVLLQQNAFPTAQVAATRDERERYMPAATLAIWRKERAEQMRFLTPAESALHERLRAKSASLVGQMQRRGVRILAGTDSPAPYVFPGSALHDELALLVEAGLTPREALETATRNAAEFLGTTENAGTVKPGKFADLVLLDADPLEDIRNTERIRAVVLRGQLLDREALDGLLAGELRFASGH
ncbi:MAG TPA: amidohydrolase family protein, partial [Candidatus Acidoferrum sp.]|nr:amidohydrolase family protein [Candidatus Acidoferrum sp.]